MLSVCYLIGAAIMAQSVASESVNNAIIDTIVPDPTPSANSESGKHHFIHSFPCHDIVKLDKSNYIQCVRCVENCESDIRAGDWYEAFAFTSSVAFSSERTLIVKEYLAKI